MEITFLSASLPLTKSFVCKDGSIEKHPYPLVSRFTTHTEQIDGLPGLFTAIYRNATNNNCLLKGVANSTLENEPRRGLTNSDQSTQWICLDLDKIETTNIDSVLGKLGLIDVSHIIQYSASHGVDPKDDGTVNAHVFMLLDNPVPAPHLKSWLIEQNLRHFKPRLSRTGSALSYQLDVTACQNDKLIYIAPPKFYGMDDPFSEEPRIRYVKRDLDAVPISRLSVKHDSMLKREARAMLNELRKEAGMDALRGQVTLVDGYDIQNKPDTCVVTGAKQDGEFTRLNLNGGDSWAYWHPNQNYEYIHDFKTGLSYRTSELLPGYYKDRIYDQVMLRGTPTEDGDQIFGFCDLDTGKYFKGRWNKEKNELKLYPAKNEKQIADWYMSHGLTPPDFIPQWRIEYRPDLTEVIDPIALFINSHDKSEYALTPARDNDEFPHIKSVIQHMLSDDGEVYEHFINWFACIFQRKGKPLTAWVCHGVEGTGKGVFFTAIAEPLLHTRNCYTAMANDIENDFNKWADNKTLILVDEVDVGDFREKGRVSARLRNYITQPTFSLREMRSDAVERPNWTSWIFASNKLQPVYIPRSDRRYNVGNYQEKRLPKPDMGLIKKELKAFAEYLAAHLADLDKASTVIDTAQRREIADMGVTSLEQVAYWIKEGNINELRMLAPADPFMPGIGAGAMAYTNMLETLIERARTTKGKMPISRDELQVLLNYACGLKEDSPNKFTSRVKHAGIITSSIRLNGKTVKGIYTEWKIEDQETESAQASQSSSSTSSAPTEPSSHG